MSKPNKTQAEVAAFIAAAYAAADAAAYAAADAAAYAAAAYAAYKQMQRECADIVREVVPWETVEAALWA